MKTRLVLALVIVLAAAVFTAAPAFAIKAGDCVTWTVRRDCSPSQHLKRVADFRVTGTVKEVDGEHLIIIIDTQDPGLLTFECPPPYNDGQKVYLPRSGVRACD